MPNAFTPNGDGVNDYFGPAGKVPDSYQMQIFNRNGEIVFRSSSMSNRWDGRYKGKPEDPNVFVYTITAKTICGTVNKKGTVVLLR